METDTYLTIKSVCEGLYREKGSRFIGYAYHVTSQEQIKSILEALRKEHHSARHYCYAWMLGSKRENFRANDDGEPSGSAGKPILGQINSHNLTDILIVVVRYFGGKLLGVSGLVNAYRTAASSALKNAEIIELYEMDYFEIKFPYSSMNDVMKLIKEDHIKIVSQNQGLECSFTVGIRNKMSDKLISLVSVIDDTTIVPVKINT